MKKIISLLLCMVLVIGLIPGVFAAEWDNYLALGDSITAGTGLNEGERAFPQILAENNSWNLSNQGVDGQTTASLLAQLNEGVYDEGIASADLVTITIGGNDMMHLMYTLVAEYYNESYDPDITPEDVATIMQDSSDSRYWSVMAAGLVVLNGDEYSGIPCFVEREEFLAKIDEFEANLKEIVTYIKGANSDVNVIVPTQYNPYKDFTGFYGNIVANLSNGVTIFNDVITANAEETGYLVADVYTAFQESSEKLCNATTSPLNLDFHPNVRGHEVIAQTLQTVIDQIPEDVEPVNPFTDVPEGEWYYEPVLWAVENGITGGTNPEGTLFAPTRDCTRAEIVTFLWRAAGKPAPTSTEHNFTDVEEGQYYYEAMLWAVEKGITKGVNVAGTLFGPTNVCTRAQVVTFLWRAKGCPEPASMESSFPDVTDPDAYYYQAVLWAVEEGITNGTGTGDFAPDQECSRAQIVTFLYRAYN